MSAWAARASFSQPGRRANYCGKHALVGMEDVRNKRCVHPGCKTLPTFGYPEDRKRRFCKAHAPEGRRKSGDR